MRSIAVTILASAWLVVVVSPRHRRAIVRRLSDARRYVSRRIVDEDARRSSQAIAAWEDEGGAMQSVNAVLDDRRTAEDPNA
jgi:hypothetical protein